MNAGGRHGNIVCALSLLHVNVVKGPRWPFGQNLLSVKAKVGRRSRLSVINNGSVIGDLTAGLRLLQAGSGRFNRYHRLAGLIEATCGWGVGLETSQDSHLGRMSRLSGVGNY
jgi:hypothetical protein